MTDEIKKPVFKAPPLPPKTISLSNVGSTGTAQQPAQQPAGLQAQAQVQTPPASGAMQSATSQRPQTQTQQPKQVRPQIQPKPILSAAQTQNQVEGKASSMPAAAASNGSEVPVKTFVEELNLPPKILETKVMGSVVAGIFLFGIMMGCAFFGGDSKQVVQGLTDVVLNPDIRYNLRRCGQIDPNRECVLYIMNSQTRDRLGSDFFQEAQNMTGVQKYSIQLANVNYANALIRPGYIAQIYIPARK